MSKETTIIIKINGNLDTINLSFSITHPLGDGSLTVYKRWKYIKQPPKKSLHPNPQTHMAYIMALVEVHICFVHIALYQYAMLPNEGLSEYVNSSSINHEVNNQLLWGSRCVTHLLHILDELYYGEMYVSKINISLKSTTYDVYTPSQWASRVAIQPIQRHMNHFNDELISIQHSMPTGMLLLQNNSITSIWPKLCFYVRINGYFIPDFLIALYIIAINLTLQRGLFSVCPQ